MDDELLRVVAMIYDAALDPAQWPAVLQAVSAYLGADGASLAIDQRQGLFALNAGCGEEALRGYDAHWHAVNPLWPGLLQAPTATVLVDRQALPDGAYLAGEFYNDFVRPRGLLANMSIKMLETPPAAAALALHRLQRPGAAAFGAADQARAALLAPHLARAMQLTDRLALLQGQSALTGEALEWLPQPSFVVEGTGRLRFANRGARALLQAADGLVALGDGLQGAEPAATEALRGLIAAAAARRPSSAGRGGTLLLRRPSGRRPLSLLVAPFHPPEGWEQLRPRPRLALVIVHDPEMAIAPPAQALRDRYGLTAAEAALALAVLGGEGLRAAAAQLGISVSTAKTHLQRVFGKTGTSRQAELVRLLLTTTGGGMTH
jgi:DNA-binding CsgD family transcriptional regulator